MASQNIQTLSPTGYSVSYSCFSIKLPNCSFFFFEDIDTIYTHKNKKEMLITHYLPRLSIPISQSPFFHTQIFFFTKPKLLISSTLISTPKISHFSSIPTIPSLAHQETTNSEEPHLQIALEKLFVPPDTEISSTDVPRILKGSNIVVSKYARDAQINQAEFIKSSVDTESCPSDGAPEFALVGRSNVGKSSLLNSLVRRKKLALTSKKPGKTQCINHFRINDSWYLVDLPGFGYASAPRELRTDWAKFTKDYFLNRSTLVSVFLLIDASIPAKKIDLEYASWLGQNQIPMTLVFTKCDKRKKKKNGGKPPEENVQDFQELIQEFFQAAPPWIMTSSVTNQGRDEILLHMAQLRNYWLKH